MLSLLPETLAWVEGLDGPQGLTHPDPIALSPGLCCRLPRPPYCLALIWDTAEPLMTSRHPQTRRAESLPPPASSASSEPALRAVQAGRGLRGAGGAAWPRKAGARKEDGPRPAALTMW